MRSTAHTLLIFFFLVVSPLILTGHLRTIPVVRASADPPLVEATLLSATASDDLDGFGSGECRIQSTVTSSGGPLHLTWPNGGSAKCEDTCDFFCTKKPFFLFPNLVIFPETAVSGGLSFHFEGQEGDAFNNWESYGTIDFTMSDPQIAAITGCAVRSATTAGGNAPMTITTQICVTPPPSAPPGCLQNGSPPLVRSVFLPMAPAAGANFTVTATATSSSSPCPGIDYVRIVAQGSALATPEIMVCLGGGPPPTFLSCQGSFGPVIEGGYVIYQVRARDATGQTTYEAPIVFDAGSPRTNSGWAAPTLLWGTHVERQGGREVGTNDRKDVIFFADGDYGTTKTQFIADAQNAIMGLFTLPELGNWGPYSVIDAGANSVMVSNQSGISYWVEESNRYRFNFWYVWDDDTSKRPNLSSHVSITNSCPGPAGCAFVDQPYIPGCSQFLGIGEPCNWGFADTKSVFHSRTLAIGASGAARDASWSFFTSCYCYTARSGNLWIVAHEMGHNLWGMGDTYCCDAPYGSDSPHKNVWGSLSECQSEASVSTPFVWSVGNCADITDPGHHYKSNPEPDIMSNGCFDCSGSYGPADENRMEYVFRGMPDPVPSTNFEAIFGVYPYAAAPISQNPNGVCVSDPTSQTESIQACFPTGVTQPSELTKFMSIGLQVFSNGTIKILGVHVLYGAPPDPRSDLAGHATVLTQTKDGEPLAWFGLPNTSADEENGTLPSNVIVSLNVEFREKSQNVTITSVNGTALLTTDLAPAVKAFCASNPNDTSCKYIPKAATSTFGPVTPTAAVIAVSAPLLIFLALARILSRRSSSKKHSLQSVSTKV